MSERSFLYLQSGPSRLTLWPEAGAAFLDWRYKGQPLLRPIAEEVMVWRDARQLGMFVLVPYSNRIGQGRFSLDGESFSLRLEPHARLHSIHGNGWYSPWRIETRSEDEAQLILDHDPAGEAARDWPFAFRASQRLKLSADGLSVGMRLENRDSRPMPAGLGLHPYFLKCPGTRMRFLADAVWTNGSDQLPRERIAIPDDWSFREARSPDAAVLDNCFAGWNGQAAIDWPGISLEIRTDPLFSHLMVYTPAGADFFCLEPVSHMTDAINRPDRPIPLLPPGGVLEGEVLMHLKETP